MYRQQDQLDTDEHVIKVTSRGSPRRYITRAASLFIEQNFEYVIFMAAGTAIETLNISIEAVKKGVKGLHQITKTKENTVQDKVVKVLEIKLTKNPSEEEKKSSDYEKACNEQDIKEFDLVEMRKEGDREYQERRGRGGFRGGRRRGGRFQRGGRGYRRGWGYNRDENENENNEEEDNQDRREGFRPMRRFVRRGRGGYDNRFEKPFDEERDTRQYSGERFQKKSYDEEDRGGYKKEYEPQEEGFREQRRGRYNRGFRGGFRGERGGFRGERGNFRGRGAYFRHDKFEEDYERGEQREEQREYPERKYSREEEGGYRRGGRRGGRRGYY